MVLERLSVGSASLRAASLGRILNDTRFAPVLGVCCYNYFCGPCAGAVSLVSGHTPPFPPVSHRLGAPYQGKGFAKTMYSVYALVYIVAAALVVTGVFLVVTSLTP